MPSEIDINLIFLKLEKLEERIKVLSADLNNLKPDDYYQVKSSPTTKLPLQWPSESYTDYLKRIGLYNEASSDNENFDKGYK